ncbi:MAG: tRNA (adenosine(37)-N6)-threonylcarbamoyltransferase complex ATPase subunit type 1 TsaE [Gemmataceae bacterium]
MLTPVTVDLLDHEATARLGRNLASRLFPGTVIALVGQLGAGKTQLVRAVAEGLDVRDPRVVTSPTFVLLQQYAGRLPIYHFDVYRLPGVAAFEDLGGPELLEGDGVCLIEWADKIEPALPVDHLRITLEATGESSRRAILQASGPIHAALLVLLLG